MTNNSQDEKYMQRCHELAKLGFGNTAPNPMVGSIIVHDNKIIGEGYHKKYGEPHAEVNAIHSVKNKKLLKESTIYVNLEPCSHHGKTPPCADLIIKEEIPEVVIGCIDTSSSVSGKGIKNLKNGGCDVRVGILEDESKQINKRFFTYHEKNRPYIILKWAQSKDGFLDKPRKHKDQKPIWITNEQAKTLVHKWRTEEMGIMIGDKTAILDNPKLTARNWTGSNPIRIIVNSNELLHQDLHIFNNDAETIIFTNREYSIKKNNIHFEKIHEGNGFFGKLFEVLISREIQSIIIEGGRQLLQSFIDNDYWDEARVFYGEVLFNEGVNAPVFAHKSIYENTIGNNILRMYRNLT